MDVTRATQESEGYNHRDSIWNGVADQVEEFRGGVLEYPHLPQQRLTVANAAARWRTVLEYNFPK